MRVFVVLGLVLVVSAITADAIVCLMTNQDSRIPYCNVKPNTLTFTARNKTFCCRTAEGYPLMRFRKTSTGTVRSCVCVSESTLCSYRSRRCNNGSAISKYVVG